MAIAYPSMPSVMLPSTRLHCSRLVFGTASLFNVGGRTKRLALLAAAVDAGFTHFDTAPYYGFGWAERDLGELRRTRPNFTVTTKVGIHSPGGENASHMAVFMRKAAGRLFPAISRPEVDFTLSRAQRALEASLSRLRREHIELYLLHEPELAMLQTDEWRRWLQSETERGRIGAFGLASTVDRAAPILDHTPELAPVVQVLDSLDHREADRLTERNRPLQITYGYVSSARARGDARPVADILAASLKRNSQGAVIVSTTRRDRLRQYPALFKDMA